MNGPIVVGNMKDGIISTGCNATNTVVTCSKKKSDVFGNSEIDEKQFSQILALLEAFATSEVAKMEFNGKTLGKFNEGITEAKTSESEKPSKRLDMIFSRFSGLSGIADVVTVATPIISFATTYVATHPEMTDSIVTTLRRILSH